jgi:hypothetical protein
MFNKNTYIGSNNSAGRDQNINIYLLGSVDYQQLIADIAEAEEDLREIPADNIPRRMKKGEKLAALRKQLEDFKANVFRLYELFNRIPINTERLRQAKAHFDRGEFREADAVLKAEEIERDVDRLKLEQTAAKDKLAAIEQDLADRANEFLLKAQLSLVTPLAEGEDRFRRTEGYFTQALAAARTPKVLGAYALFLHNHREFRKSEPLWQEALKKYRGITEGDSEAIAADIAITLNNLGALHKAITDYDLALKEYEEALNIYRPLAKSNPTAFRPYLATTLNNLANLHFHQNDFGPALEAYQESLKIGRSLAEVNREAFLPGVAQTLHNMANLHCETREHGKALEEYRESLSMYHDLADANPESFLPYLATTLNSFANLHSRRENFDLALEAYQKALKIRRGLADANPEAFLPDVAQTLHNMANLHFAKKEHDQALGEYKEALKTYRSLAESNPEAFRPDVATTLNSLAALHGETKNYITAIEEFEEALQIRRKFGSSNPKAFLPYVAETLVNLSIFHLKVVSDKAKSVAYAEEARSILIPLCAQAPHLQKYLDTAEQVLKANAAGPAA